MTLPAEVQVARTDGWLSNDRIRLTGLLREEPAPAGSSYVWTRLIVAPNGHVSAMMVTKILRRARVPSWAERGRSIRRPAPEFALGIGPLGR